VKHDDLAAQEKLVQRGRSTINKPQGTSEGRFAPAPPTYSHPLTSHPAPPVSPYDPSPMASMGPYGAPSALPQPMGGFEVPQMAAAMSSGQYCTYRLIFIKKKFCSIL